MLNITGGGEKLFKKTHEVFYKKPDLILHPEKEDKNDIINTVEHLFRP